MVDDNRTNSKPQNLRTTLVKNKEKLILVLAGNPNIGKSVIFNNLTGLGVTVSNYPGTTVEFTEGTSKFGNREIEIIDLPGTYSLSSNSMDQIVARNKILEYKDKAVIVNVLDASNLERNLILTLELVELEVPFIICLNMIDEAKKKGVKINYEKLAAIFGVPVIPTIAIQGKGIDTLVETAFKVFKGEIKAKPMIFKFGKDIEDRINQLANVVATNNIDKELSLSARATAIKLIEQDPFIFEYIRGNYPKIHKLVLQIIKKIEKEHDESSSVRVAKERNAIATSIADLVKEQIEYKELLSEKIDKWTTRVSTGFPIMIGVWFGLLAILIFVGGFLEELFVTVWDILITNPVDYLLSIANLPPAIEVIFIKSTLIGIEATLAVILPYAGLFYILLSIMEDTGYMTRMAFLMDSIMHKIGLHGKSVIPLIAGFLESKREKIIATFMITLIPCAARTSIILGAVGANIGFLPVLFIYAIIFVIIFISGFVLNKIMKGEKSGLVIEMPPYRTPKIKNVFKKTWVRIREFLIIAMPLIIIGSITLGALAYFDIVTVISEYMGPIITGWLGLPPETGVVLIFGVLRKELALIMLYAVMGTTDLLTVMTPINLIVFALVVAIYIPCLATFAAIKHEIGLKYAVLIAIGTITIAILAGGITNSVLTFIFGG
ncbi:MAG: ferrous iron transport protein B [Candidatus Odinarchaeia archaeon]